MFGIPVTVCCCLKFYSCFKVELMSYYKLADFSQTTHFVLYAYENMMYTENFSIKTLFNETKSLFL